MPNFGVIICYILRYELDLQNFDDIDQQYVQMHGVFTY